MQLDAFITETLLSIRSGLRAANMSIAEADGKRLGHDAAALFQMGPYEDEGGYINFDIAVTVGGESSTKGGGGLQIAVVKLGGEINDVMMHQNVSRIKFSIRPSLHTG